MEIESARQLVSNPPWSQDSAITFSGGSSCDTKSLTCGTRVTVLHPRNQSSGSDGRGHASDVDNTDPSR
jgi:hypothetical protein